MFSGLQGLCFPRLETSGWGLPWESGGEERDVPNTRSLWERLSFGEQRGHCPLQGIRFCDRCEMVMAEPLPTPPPPGLARQCGEDGQEGGRSVQREAWRGGGPEKDPSSRRPQEWASGPSATPTEVNPELSLRGSSRGPQAGLSSPKALAQRSRGPPSCRHSTKPEADSLQRRQQGRSGLGLCWSSEAGPRTGTS